MTSPGAPLSRRAIVAATFLVAFAGATLAARAADAPAGAPAAVVLQRGAVSGKRQNIGFYYELNPDCSTDGSPVVHLILPPARGKLEAVPGDAFSNSPPGSHQFGCGTRKTAGVLLFYTSDPGFQGTDQVILSVIYPHGERLVTRILMTVEPDDSVHTAHDGWRKI